MVGRGTKFPWRHWLGMKLGRPVMGYEEGFRCHVVTGFLMEIKMPSYHGVRKGIVIFFCHVVGRAKQMSSYHGVRKGIVTTFCPGLTCLI